ncbi:MAG TPA: phosphotransferase [Pseudonocardia sp.]|nr:phosphotransferase [Pseudonocardia sp.]
MEIVARGLAAAAEVAAARGLPTGDLRVLSARGNLVVHLAPAPVVARVATLTAATRCDPAAWLAREVAVARYAAERGGPVVAPAAEPGPHTARGLAITLWTHHETAPDVPGPEVVGTALAALHAAAAGCPAPLPHLAPARDQVTEALDALERDRAVGPEVLTALRAQHAEVLTGLDGTGPALTVLHGDAHAGNLVRGADGAWRWIDLEETCTGPPEWDLAVMAGRSGPAALTAYARASGCPVPTPAALAPFARARELEAVVWLLAMARQNPERYRETADARLAALLARPLTGSRPQ